MKETQVDADGNVRCPKCGAIAFSDKRTGKAKVFGVVTLGVGVVAMPKRLKCRGCGENLKRGGSPYVDRKAAQTALLEQAKVDRIRRKAKGEERKVQREEKREEKREAKATAQEAKEADSASISPPLPPSAIVQPASWQADPTGRHELRYWDGTAWTSHISDTGVQGADPFE